MGFVKQPDGMWIKKYCMSIIFIKIYTIFNLICVCDISKKAVTVIGAYFKKAVC